MFGLTLLTVLVVQGCCHAHRQRKISVQRGESWAHFNATGRYGTLPTKDIVSPWRMPRSCSGHDQKSDKTSLEHGDTAGLYAVKEETRRAVSGFCKDICESYGRNLKNKYSTTNQRICNTATESASADCEEMNYELVWIPKARKCIYAGKTQNANNADAEGTCKMMGGKLLQVDNQQVLDAIAPNYQSTYWVDGTYVKKKNYWRYDDDNMAKFYNYGPSPRLAPQEGACWAIGPKEDSDDKLDLYFHDYKCDHRGLNYICQF